MADRLLTPAEVAAAIGVNTGDVLRLIHAGQLPAKRLICRGEGKRPRLRVRESDLVAFIDGLGNVEPHIEPIPKPRRSRRAAAVPVGSDGERSYY